MTTLYLHIGTEKTGTTSIQKALRENAEILKRRNVYVPKLNQNEIAHSGLVNTIHPLDNKGRALEFYSRTPEECEIDWDILSRQAASLNDNQEKIVLSSEHFSSRLRINGITDLKRRLHTSIQGVQIKVIVYLRRQDDFILSSYSTAVKAGSTESLQQFVSRYPHQKQRYDYTELLSPWIEVFGSNALEVRSYEKAKEGHGLLGDFFSLFGINVEDLDLSQQISNSAWSRKMLEIARLVNQPRISNLLQTKRLNFLQKIEKSLSELKHNPPCELDNATRKEIHEAFLNSNKAIENKYWFSDCWLSEASDKSYVGGNEPEITRLELIEIMVNEFMVKE